MTSNLIFNVVSEKVDISIFHCGEYSVVDGEEALIICRVSLAIRHSEDSADRAGDIEIVDGATRHELESFVNAMKALQDGVTDVAPIHLAAFEQRFGMSFVKDKSCKHRGMCMVGWICGNGFPSGIDRQSIQDTRPIAFVRTTGCTYFVIEFPHHVQVHVGASYKEKQGNDA